MKHYEMNYDIEFDITCFSSGNDLLQTINKTPCFQILFLDVEMPGLSGIETAARVREIDMEDVCIIFVIHNICRTASMYGHFGIYKSH